MSLLNRLSGLLDTIVRGFLGLTLFTMFSLVVIQVFLRYIFKTPLAWTDEMARYLMTVLVFIGACVASKSASHLGVTVLYDKLSPKPRAFMTLLINIMVCGFLSIVMVQGWSLLDSVGNAKSPVLQMSMAIPYSSVPIGCALMLVQTIIATLNEFVESARKISEAN